MGGQHASRRALLSMKPEGRDCPGLTRHPSKQSGGRKPAVLSDRRQRDRCNTATKRLHLTSIDRQLRLPCTTLPTTPGSPRLRSARAKSSAAAIWPPLRRFIAGEQRLGRHMARRRWTAGLYEFLRFGVKQGWACLFGGIAITLMIGTYRLYPAGASLARYDFLFLSMIAVQIALLAGRLETLGRGEGHPDLSSRRNGDGNLQDVGRLLDLSGAELLPDRRRAAVHRLHVFLHRQLSVPRLAAVRFSLRESSAALDACRSQRCDLCEFLRPPLCARPAAFSVCRSYNAARPHDRLLQGLARLSLDAPASRPRTGVALHLVVGEHRHLHENLALSVAAARLGHGRARQARFVVPVTDYQLLAGEPDQHATALGRMEKDEAGDREPELGTV